MPINCPLTFAPISTEEFALLDYAVMAHFYASVKELGRLADEAIYQAEVFERLQSAKFHVQREVPVTVSFETFAKTYYLDLVVSQQAVYELKTTSQIILAHGAQLMNYLLMLDLRRGKLVNLRPTSVESRFENAPRTSASRKKFAVVRNDWSGDERTLD